jgi:uncharacterized protein DUF2637
MTTKSAQLRRSRHSAGISARPAFTTVSGQRATLTVAGTGNPSRYRTTGALALAPVFPLALAGPADIGTSASSRPARDPSALWLRSAAAGLGVLAAAAAAVSFTAQYRMVNATRHLPAIAALEAAIPDTSALVFASLGIALAMHGRRALRARGLNLAAVASSVAMNVLAAGPGWRDLAIWALPPVAYALASDTLITVIRARAVTRDHLAPGTTPLAALGRLILWLLRLALAPASTLAGFRAWVFEQCPVTSAPRSAPSPYPAGDPRPTKTARFLDLVTERHGPLASIPLPATARIAATLAPLADLNPGAARTALRKAVQAAQTGDPR